MTALLRFLARAFFCVLATTTATLCETRLHYRALGRGRDLR